MTNENTQTPGPKPAPHLIRFDEDCFVDAGSVDVFVVAMSGLHSGPMKTYNREEAESYAKKTGRIVRVSTETTRRRIKWF